MIIEYRERLFELAPYMPPRLAKALAWLREADFDRMGDGECEIDGRDIYARIRASVTQEKQQCRLESHERYIDVQYIISGRDLICCGPKQDGHLIVEENRDDDNIFYKEALCETDYLIQAGQMMVIFPWEVHRGNCHADGGPLNIRKAIIKVRAAER